MLMIRNIFLGLLPLLLIGCATNPYQEYYTDNTRGRDLLASSYIVPPSPQPQLFRGTDQNEDAQKMLEDGYFLIGFSQFNARAVSNAYALAFAKKVHAAEVLVYSRYTHTVTEMVPTITPVSKTIETVHERSRSWDDRGRGPMASPSVTTTTITEFDTTYVPTAVDQYDYFATYWIKGRPSIVGIRPRNLSADERQRLGTNKGLVVLAVVTGSPAFKADIFKGDIVQRVDDQDIVDVHSFYHTIVPPLQGKTALFTILRDGQILIKEVQVGQKL